MDDEIEGTSLEDLREVPQEEAEQLVDEPVGDEADE